MTDTRRNRRGPSLRSILVGLLALALAAVTWLIALPLILGMWGEGEPPRTLFVNRDDQEVWVGPVPERPLTYGGHVLPHLDIGLLATADCIATGTFEVREAEDGPVLYTRDLSVHPLCPGDQWVWRGADNPGV